VLRQAGRLRIPRHQNTLCFRVRRTDLGNEMTRQRKLWRVARDKRRTGNQLATSLSFEDGSQAGRIKPQETVADIE
jgi:hypothetical protein